MRMFDQSAAALSQQVRAGELPAASIAAFYQKRTEALAGRYNSHLCFDGDDVAAELQRIEGLLGGPAAAAGSYPLAGLPVLIKDNIATLGLPMSCGSKMLAGYRPPYDATAVARLRAAGAVIFGKTNLDEFGMGSTSEHSAFGAVRNPWATHHVAGGSSGGSAAALAADLAPLALGSDTGGSIRQPASFCGVSGFKPTYGRVSRYGLTAYASSLDHIGPMARRVADLTLVYDVIAGFDPLDATSLPAAAGDGPAFPQLAAWQQACAGRRIGVLTFEGPATQGLLAPAVTQSLSAAAAAWGKLGATIVPIDVQGLEHAVATYYIIAMAEASSNLARFDGVRYGLRTQDPQANQNLASMVAASRREGFGREVVQRIIMGTFILSAGYAEQYYEKACRARQYIRQQFAKAFQGVDVILAPTTPTTAFALGSHRDDPVALYLQDICTTPANLAGLPSLSLPAGFDEKGLPVGVQVLGPPRSDTLVLQLGHAYQQVSDWHLRRPAAEEAAS